MKSRAECGGDDDVALKCATLFNGDSWLADDRQVYKKKHIPFDVFKLHDPAEESGGAETDIVVAER